MYYLSGGGTNNKIVKVLAGEMLKPLDTENPTRTWIITSSTDYASAPVTYTMPVERKSPPGKYPIIKKQRKADPIQFNRQGLLNLFVGAKRG